MTDETSPAKSHIAEHQQKPMEPKDVFKFVLDTRNFEITNFWQRSNYFLVLNTGVAIAFFNLKEKSVEWAPFVALVGVLVSFLWIRVALGSKFWQVHWERKLAQVENEYVASRVLPDLKLFNQSTTQVKAEVSAALADEQHANWVEWLIDKRIVEKPSVTLAMISLSLLFCVAWAVLLVVSVGMAAQ
jgi:hypothetical protein